MSKDKKSILQKELSTKEVLVALGAFSVCFAYGYFFVYPKYTEYKASVANLESIEAQVMDYEDKISEMPIKKKELENLNKEVDVKSKMLAHNMEDGMFLIGLSKIMNKEKVDLVDYTMEEKVPYETFYAIPTTLTVRGDYRHVREIMDYMEEQKNMTQILDYSMENYIEESKNEGSQGNTGFKKQPLNSEKVYWLDSDDILYHSTDTCPNVKNSSNALINGNLTTAKNEGKVNGDKTCIASASESVDGGNEVDTTVAQKATGEVVATFKFMMYSSNEPSLDLNNDDSSKWKPGKYNPFTTTTR